MPRMAMCGVDGEGVAGPIRGIKYANLPVPRLEHKVVQLDHPHRDAVLRL
jgi:hypothetical protein